MKDLSELSNAEGLDESITEDYSNINWKDPFKGARDAAKKIKEEAKRVRDRLKEAAKKVKEEAERQKKQLDKLGKKIADKAKEVGGKIKSKAKEIDAKAKERAKKFATKARDEAKRVRNSIKEVEKKIGKELKRVATKIKEVAKKIGDKFRNAFRKVIRGLILKSIKGNVHGMAARMYAAIATEDELKARKFKPKFAGNAKKAYSTILSEWKKLGGSESELNDAIVSGHSKRMLKNPFNRADGNNHDEFYSYIASEDYYHGADGDATDDEKEIAIADAEKMKADEESAVVINEDAATVEAPEAEEKQSGFKAFIAKILSLFKKHKADEAPYEEGTPEATDLATDEKADAGNRPPEGGDSSVLDELDKHAESDANSAPKNEDDEDDDDDESVSKDGSGKKTTEDGDGKILGMPKGVAIGVGVALVAVLGIVAFKYFKGKK
jgi:hypothetical protein